MIFMKFVLWLTCCVIVLTAIASWAYRLGADGHVISITGNFGTLIALLFAWTPFVTNRISKFELVYIRPAVSVGLVASAISCWIFTLLPSGLVTDYSFVF